MAALSSIRGSSNTEAISALSARVATLADSAEIASVLLLPLMLLSAAMFFTSSYFTFRDSFVNDPILA